MFANFTPRIRQIKLTREQLQRSVITLTETRDDLRRFLDEECATSNEWQDFETVSERVDQLNASAIQLTERAESKLQIAFVGSVGAGKSTLINALLGEDIMPVTRAETTFCNVAVTGSSSNEWTAVERSTGRALEITEFRQLLHVLKAREQRETLGLTPSSVIDVKWPTARCKALVENVVLYDTPGIGERKATDDAVIELCKFVDVIVAVMDIHSPTLRTVSNHLRSVLNQINPEASIRRTIRKIVFCKSQLTTCSYRASWTSGNDRDLSIRLPNVPTQNPKIFYAFVLSIESIFHPEKDDSVVLFV